MHCCHCYSTQASTACSLECLHGVVQQYLWNAFKKDMHFLFNDGTLFPLVLPLCKMVKTSNLTTAVLPQMRLYKNNFVPHTIIMQQSQVMARVDGTYFVCLLQGVQHPICFLLQPCKQSYTTCSLASQSSEEIMGLY